MGYIAQELKLIDPLFLRVSGSTGVFGLFELAASYLE